MTDKATAKKNLTRSGGRPKGSRNKIPSSIKDAVLEVWAQLERENKGLGDIAREQPEWFYLNFLKPMLPKSIDLGVQDTGPLADLLTMIAEHGPHKPALPAPQSMLDVVPIVTEAHVAHSAKDNE